MNDDALTGQPLHQRAHIQQPQEIQGDSYSIQG